ncbi:5'-methylthioadenosine/S-adenosylhomocysteine nucleosidase [Lactococcus hodotermopsidis]|uniref:adenosylhomocysteine nucleosidase n=1 Tax=Pseudolactococcus hodotermopsidis TaxID=2709157 RepID=A0A6A0BDV8_9LACT|nr:5'-methylthioadenosine/adenosylhomocysteine nucleosidase [Lactococcus hodotermopsidis]GFH42528.1 5'-methylthioadenosine/S-adenosylhomocysteine nucleosidase [Lactococcus hodotermopsidis]
MKIGIIAAMDEELKILADTLKKPEKATRHGFVFYTGIIGRHDIVLVKSGIGKVMSAVAVTLLVELFHVDGIVNTGSAGGVGEGLVVGDIVIADKLAYHDVDVTAFGYAFGQMAGQELYYHSSKYFVSELKKADLSAKTGLITSSDSFISSKERQLEIKAHFPTVLAVEMEGASVAQAAHALNKPFVVIRSISDTADGQAAESFDDFIVHAGEKSAQILIKMLEKMV